MTRKLDIKAIKMPLAALLTAMLIVSQVSCRQRPEIPAQALRIEVHPPILPDYADVTVPINIAPLNFSISNDSLTDCVARFSFPGGSYCYGDGHKVVIDPDEWREMLQASCGQSMNVEVYASCGGRWHQFKDFRIHVSPDSIDPYIAYRLIPPYNTYERISLCQRNLENFDEYEFYNNRMLETDRSGHCVNCHAFQNYQTKRMQFHVREEFAGTMISEINGQGHQIKKVNMKLPETISSGVYPAWHPSLNLIAYSVNKSFIDNHTDGLTKSEVQDSESGLILYDNEHDRVIPICNAADTLETFPTWSPDGNYLYYAAAKFVFQETLSSAVSTEIRIRRQHEVLNRYREVRYDIYRRHFDARNLSFGPAEPVMIVSDSAESATLPRISPDGRWLLTCIGQYGCFHIYHPEADLYVMPLIADTDSLIQTRRRPLTEANSERAESYHNWSSNGRWIVFQSRRRDNNYTRLYFTHFDENGNSTKAFEMPQRDPDHELLHTNSYNIPEFTTEAVTVSPDTWAQSIGK